MCRVVGITGSIATGKSLVSHYLAKQFPLVDADQVARLILLPGAPALAKVKEHFGASFIQSDGQLDRAKLASLIFSQPQKRSELDCLLAPYLREELAKQVKRAKEVAQEQSKPLVFVDIPLLYEQGFQNKCDEVWVVYVPEYQQLDRLMARDQISKQDALDRMASQWPIEIKRALADHVVNNTGEPIVTLQQVDKLIRAY